jgi:hypothetical protein
MVMTMKLLPICHSVPSTNCNLTPSNYPPWCDSLNNFTPNTKPKCTRPHSRFLHDFGFSQLPRHKQVKILAIWASALTLIWYSHNWRWEASSEGRSHRNHMPSCCPAAVDSSSSLCSKTAIVISKMKAWFGRHMCVATWTKTPTVLCCMIGGCTPKMDIFL